MYLKDLIRSIQSIQNDAILYSLAVTGCTQTASPLSDVINTQTLSISLP